MDNEESNRTMPMNIWVLFLAQSCAMCAAPLIVFAGGLVGAQMASYPGLATLPVALMVTGTALTVYPTAMLSARLGRKSVFLIGMATGSGAALLCAIALLKHSFWLFSAAAFILGFVLACVQQFRFAAMESVSASQVPVAVSRILMAGIIAAFAGPELVIWGEFIHAVRYVGAFFLLAGLYIIALLILWVGYSATTPQVQAAENQRMSVTELLSNPGVGIAIGSAAIGFAIMSFIMTATPISMHELNNIDIQETKKVIQGHIMAMFIPSLFSGWLIHRLGFPVMIGAGVLSYLLCLIIAWWDQELLHYWLALILLGIGWNFLFVAGTSLLPQMHAPQHTSQVQGVNDLLVFSAQAVASLTSGAILLLWGWQTLVLLACPLLVFLMYLLWRWQYQYIEVKTSN